MAYFTLIKNLSHLILIGQIIFHLIQIFQKQVKKHTAEEANSFENVVSVRRVTKVINGASAIGRCAKKASFTKGHLLGSDSARDTPAKDIIDRHATNNLQKDLTILFSTFIFLLLFIRS